MTQLRCGNRCGGLRRWQLLGLRGIGHVQIRDQGSVVIVPIGSESEYPEKRLGHGSARRDEAQGVENAKKEEPETTVP